MHVFFLSFRQSVNLGRDGHDFSHVQEGLTCKKWLKEVHPDVSKQETYTNTEVAAIVNDIRQAAVRP